MIAFAAVLDRLNDLFGHENFSQAQKVSFLETLLATLLADDALVQQAAVNTRGWAHGRDGLNGGHAWRWARWP